MPEEEVIGYGYVLKKFAPVVKVDPHRPIGHGRAKGEFQVHFVNCTDQSRRPDEILSLGDALNLEPLENIDQNLFLEQYPKLDGGSIITLVVRRIGEARCFNFVRAHSPEGMGVMAYWDEPTGKFALPAGLYGFVEKGS